MTKYRGCIDIHNGQVKQIVGGTLSDDDKSVKTNFVADNSAEWFGELYRSHAVEGTHVIKLGPGCDEAAQQALTAWPNKLQIGGGISVDNARIWIDQYKASKVIVTSYLFPDAKFSLSRLQALTQLVGKEHLVVDLSCRRQPDGKWVVAMNRWQTLTDLTVEKNTLDMLSSYCSEFLVHAADVEGLCQGIDEDLVKALGEWTEIPCVYAGGAKNIDDLALVERLSNGKVDLTYGSALDIFGGDKVKFTDAVQWNSTH